jgi:hypothetical protein
MITLFSNATGDFAFSTDQIGVICQILQNGDEIDTLAQFIWSVPDKSEYKCCEQILISQAIIAFHRQNFKELYHLLQTNHFSAHRHPELQTLWMKAHYIEVSFLN